MGERAIQRVRAEEREGDGLFIHTLAMGQEHSVLVCLWGNREYVSAPREPDLLSVHRLSAASAVAARRLLIGCTMVRRAHHL